MKERIICKCLAVAVIVLFMGVGIQSAFAVDPSVNPTSIPEEIYDFNIEKYISLLIPQ